MLTLVSRYVETGDISHEKESQKMQGGLKPLFAHHEIGKTFDLKLQVSIFMWTILFDF